MTLLFLLFAALLLLAVGVYFAFERGTPTEAWRNRYQTDIIVNHYPDSDAFDAAFEKHIAPHTDKYFDTKVTGVSFPNADGSSRVSIIQGCEPMELLRLELGPNNPDDPNAIAVKRVDGSQLGYLERRVASDLHRDAGKPVSWSAIFKHANRHPDTDEVVGAVIVLTRSKVENPDDF